MANPETQIVLGITMFEDVFLAVYLSLISGMVLSGATSVGRRRALREASRLASSSA
jgi:hypothetical protein